MTDKKDTPSPDASADSAAKRPHATIDLRATEVKGSSLVTPIKPLDPQATNMTGAMSSSSASKPSAAPEQKATTSVPPAGVNVKEPSSSKSASAPPAPPVTVVQKPRIFTHLLAGLAGGALALFGAYRIGPTLGIDFPAFANRGADADVEKRLAALESAPKPQTVSPDQIGELTARIEKLDQTASVVKAIEAEQVALAEQTKSATATAEKAAETNAKERIEKLEERLATIAAAAGTNPDEGRIQGLAAVTGKVADLETSITTKLAELRKSLSSELEERLAAASEASEKARTGTERLDREVAAMKLDTARLQQSIEVQKADSERFGSTVQAMQEETAKVTSSVNGLKSAFDSQLASVARPADVASAVTPVSEKLAALETSLASVVKGEDQRKESAERIVVSLELANLKRALERGNSYARELEAVNQAAAGKIDLKPLEAYKDTGVKTVTALQTDLSPVISAAIDADTQVSDGSVIDRLLAGAKSAVRVRKVNAEPNDKSAEAVMARIETALQDNRLGDVLAMAKDIPEKAAPAVKGWLATVEARHSVDAAITTVEKSLKSALVGQKSDDNAGEPAPPSAEQ